MTNFLFLIIAVFIFSNSFSQKLVANNQPKILCNSFQKLQVKARVVINGFEKKAVIKKSELVNDLWIALTDTTYKIVGFIAVYDCHSGSVLFDINEKTFYGNRIKANDNFIRGVWVGDTFVIDCINAEKKGKRYIINSLQFEIIN